MITNRQSFFLFREFFSRYLYHAGMMGGRKDVRLILLTAHLLVFSIPAHTDDAIPATVIWQALDNGLESSVITLPATSQVDPGRIHALRCSPDDWFFEPLEYRAHANNRRLSASGWQKLTGATFVINAGQYTADFRHLGWFIHNSINLGSSRHPVWKGIFSGNPKPDPSKAGMTIIDLKFQPLSFDTLPYKNAVQSLMLFDRQGIIRVNNTDKTARRCIIAQDGDGLIYVLITEKDWTLWNLASYLKSCDLNLKQAMSLDGGAQAQLALKSGQEELLLPRFQMALPCAIGFYPYQK
jgi:uncharacterized protein YigE (DUF2233 family)